MRRLKFFIYFAVTLVFGGGVLLMSFRHLGFFEVTHVPIEVISDNGQAHLVTPTEARLKERLQSAVNLLRGKKIWEIDISHVRASLVHDEWVKDVLISRSFPNDVRVIVRAKTSAAVLMSSRGEFLPVTDEGAVLGALPSGALPDVPVFRGEIFSQEPARRIAMVQFLTTLPAQGLIAASNISDVGWTADDGYTLTLIQPRTEVKLGEERVDLKALRTAQVLNYLGANNLKARVIDASYAKKVLVRLRKGP